MELFRKVYKEGVEDYQLDSGVMSMVYWDKLLPILETAVKLQPDETIAGIVITTEGIKVKFEKTTG